MKLAPITDIELIVLSYTAIRCLIAKGILTSDDIMADLARQETDDDTAFRLKACLDEMPKQ